MNPQPLFVFPKWSNKATTGLLVTLMVLPLYLGALLAYGANPDTLHVGYAPVQPVPFSHALHAGQLGMDCRYCHTTVESASFAAIPPTETCMNCHTSIQKSSPKLAPIIESYATGLPVKWVKVHDLPDYAYFNHAAHVNAGVGCNECHGQVDKMEVVYQAEPLNMAWCLACHRDPEPRLRPKDQVTNLNWNPGGKSRRDFTRAQDLVAKYHVNPNTDCVTCHR